MAKKNSQKDTSGVIFDTASKMVMSQGGTHERMKEKISAVRAVVPNKSNNEIVLVLQHFENCVDRAVQAFVEGSATEILKEWNVTGKKKPKKKKPKPKPQPEVSAEPEPEPAEPDPAEATPPSDGKEEEINGFHANGSIVDGDSLDSLSEQMDSASLDAAELDSEPATPELSDATSGVEMDAKPRTQSQASHLSQGSRGQPGQRGGKSRPRPASNTQTTPTSVFFPEDGLQGAASNKKIAPNIDRSVKDLQRCTASLSRYRVVVKDEMDSSIKRMKQTFAELQSCLMDREVALLAEMDKVKAEAMAILDGRQKKAEELRRLTDQSASMSEDQLSELRADIKHFVSERKYDEDLGRAVKFTYELEPLKKSIMGFGQVYHPQTGYSSRSRCSSAASSITGPSSKSEASSPPPLQAPPPVQAPPQASGYGSRPAQPHRQGYQGNNRQNYHAGGQRYNGGPHQDRNPNRTGHRYQGNRGPGGGVGGGGGNAYQSSQSSSASGPISVTVNGSAQSSPLPPRQDRPSTNGLPQRIPRTHCP